MRIIRKKAEPRSLQQHRQQKFSNYENYSQKDDLRKNLMDEQHGLCCYCMSRIRPEVGGMKIEHWQPQTKYSGAQLNYGNILGACMGNEGLPYSMQYCDTHKAESEISKNPSASSHNVESFVEYSGNGRIYSSDARFNEDINMVLNLNSAFLVSNRKSVLDAFKTFIEKNNSGTITNDKWNKIIKNWDGSTGGYLEPYCQVIVHWIKKKMSGPL